MNKEQKKIVDYTFRDKSISWRKYHAIVTFEDGSKISDTNKYFQKGSYFL